MKFVEAAIIALRENKNEPMSSAEIWEKIKEMVETNGKTPSSSLNTIMLRHTKGYMENPLYSKYNKESVEYFEVIGNPNKFRLKNYVPKSIKDSLINEGFITKEMLKEILSKNNINIEI